MTALEELRELRRQKDIREGMQPSPKSPISHGLTLAQLAESGRTVRIYSDVLDEEVLFAADNAHVPQEETRAVYRARELKAICGKKGDMSAEGLRLLHEVKTRFGSEVVSEESDTDDNPTNA